MSELLTKIATAFEQGGFFMWPILGLQLFSLTIIAERVYNLFFTRKVDQKEFVNTIEGSIRRGELGQVTTHLQAVQAQYPVAKAILAGCTSAQALGGKDEIQGKMDEVLLSEVSLIERRTGFLAVLGNVATLTGLLGTITGMIKSFAAVSYANPSEKAALLAAGISEAMNATAYGLIVAVPALLAYAVLMNRNNILVEDLSQAALKAFNLLSYSYDPMALKSSRTKENVREGHA